MPRTRQARPMAATTRHPPAIRLCTQVPSRHTFIHTHTVHDQSHPRFWWWPRSRTGSLGSMVTQCATRGLAPTCMPFTTWQPKLNGHLADPNNLVAFTTVGTINRMPPVCLVTHDSHTEEQPISPICFEAFPPSAGAPAEFCYCSCSTVLTGDEVGETHIPSA
jgi:hypothetical protein